MKKRALALVLSVVTALSLLTACGGSTGASTSTQTQEAAGEATGESTIYPTPEGVTYKAIAEGKSAPDWSEYEALITEIKTTTDMENRVALMHKTCPRDVLKINLASEPAKVDPALNSSVDGACLAVNMFEGLYTYDKDGNLQPALAENTEISEDGMTYTFTLRDGLKWSDGTDLTAHFVTALSGPTAQI